jgi:hypothetical protein
VFWYILVTKDNTKRDIVFFSLLFVATVATILLMARHGLLMGAV